MATGELNAVLDHIRMLTAAQTSHALSDQALLDRFIAERDEGVFAALAERHGGMVLGICRRVLRHTQDAEDACQAAFLVLARKARSIQSREALPSWLHRVAYHIARNLKRDLARRRARQPLIPEPAPADPAAEVSWREVEGLLDEELARLPEHYRAPLVLCYLEGKTRDEAALQLGWSLPTLRGRLERGRERLRARLIRRGLTLSAALMASGLAAHATAAAMPPALWVGTVKSGLLHATGKTCVSPRVAALAECAIRTLAATKLKAAFTLLAVALAAGLAIGFATSSTKPLGKPTEVTMATSQDAAPVRALPLTDADGDALPAGAIRRLGSLRFRQGIGATYLLPLPDGKALLSGSFGSPVFMWDFPSGKLIREIPPSRMAALSGNGRTLALAQGDAIRLWDIPSGKDLGRLQGRHKGVFAFAFSQDGATLASGGTDRTIRLWDLATYREKDAIPVPLSQVSFLALTPDGTNLIAGDGPQETILRIDLNTGRPMQQFKLGQRIYAQALSPDGRILATGSSDGTVPLWDTVSGQLLRKLRAGQPLVVEVAFSSDGNTLAWSEGDRSGEELAIRCWNLAEDKEIGCLNGQHYWADCLAFSMDGKVLHAGLRDGLMAAWDLSTGQAVPVPGVNRFPVDMVSLSPDGTKAAVGNLDHLRCWDVRTGRDSGTFAGYRRGNESRSLAPDWRTLAVANRDYSVSLWDVDSQRLIRRLVPNQPPPTAQPTDCADPSVIGAVAFTPDGTKLAAGGWDATIRIWDWKAGKQLHQLHWPGRMIGRLAFSADGSILAALARNFNPKNESIGIAFWDVKTGKPLPWLMDLMTPPPGKLAVRSLDQWLKSLPIFSADGRLAVRVRPQDTLPVWDLSARKECLGLAGHRGIIWAAAFSADSRTLASAGSDNTIRLWDLTTGNELARFTGHRGKATCLAFSADGKLLISGGDDTTALVWDVERYARRKGSDGLLAQETK
jgi:RNA polymerase sigma factor (sigma-70 family)